MKRQHKLISKLLPVTSYDDLDKWAVDFFQDQSPIKMLAVLGPPGRQKSTIFGKHLSPGHLFLKGHITAFKLYQELFLHRDEIVFFDDADDLLEDRTSRNLLKNLCETQKKSNEIMWTTASSKQLEDAGIPARFTTSSRVLLIINDIETAASTLGPILSRANALWFNPSAEEVHQRVVAGGWVKDQEILDFIGKYVAVISDPDMRIVYQRAEQYKNLGRDWRSYLLQIFFANDLSLKVAAAVMIDPSLKTVPARVAKFIALGGGSRATYFRRQKELDALRR